MSAEHLAILGVYESWFVRPESLFLGSLRAFFLRDFGIRFPPSRRPFFELTLPAFFCIAPAPFHLEPGVTCLPFFFLLW